MGDNIKRVINDHVAHHIKAYIVDPKAIAHLGPDIKKSFVLFRGTNRLYRDYPDEGYPGRVLKGELVLDFDMIKETETNFTLLKSNRIREDVLGNGALDFTP